MTYKTKGTCSSQIDFDLKDGKVYNVRFTGGCNGNLKGIGALVEGQMHRMSSTVWRELPVVSNPLHVRTSWQKR